MTSNNTPPGAAGLGIWGNLGIWIAFGTLFGSLFGVLVEVFFDTAGLGVALGSGLGVCLGVVVYLLFIAGRNAGGES